MEVRKEDVERILELKRDIVSAINKTQTDGRDSERQCTILLTNIYLERFSPISESVKPMEKCSLPRIGDLSLEKIRARDVELVDVLSCPEEPALAAMHKRLELIDHGMVDIRDDMKGLRTEVDGKLKDMKDNQRMMMEEI
ncbi:hypothetical protein M9H77_17122 [Catharanthus roseus]|uniref:Uncharacterized protein n=1 Tax=Catharanthus roseus TaxID=4058 RepID=A0ACC0B3R2_CATRO|nr:hypothetical protein M9H77_17122 [Catharanthus roseus]